MDVTSLFLTEPLLAVRWGQRDLGRSTRPRWPPGTAPARRSCSAGAPGAFGDVDWDRRVVWVEPVDEPGRSRWAGAGRALSAGVVEPFVLRSATRSFRPG